MSGERIERHQIAVRDSEVFSSWPINWAGAGLFLRNGNSNDVTVTLHHSDDGATWTVLLFSTPTASGQVSIILKELSFAAILFTTDRKYFRISVSAADGDTTEDGVYAHLVQWPPKPRERVTEYGD